MTMLFAAPHDSACGPRPPSSASAWNGSYLRISCRQRRLCTTAEDDPKRSSDWACENTTAQICTGWSNCGTRPSFESKRVSGQAFSSGSRAARQEMLSSA